MSILQTVYAAKRIQTDKMLRNNVCDVSKNQNTKITLKNLKVSNWTAAQGYLKIKEFWKETYLKTKFKSIPNIHNTG